MDENTKQLLTSRKFWAAVIGLVVVVIAAYMPGLQLDVEHAAELIAVVAAYIVGVGLDPGANAGTWLGILKSRKFWGALVGFIYIWLDAFHVIPPVPQETVLTLISLVVAIIFGSALEGRIKASASKSFTVNMSTSAGGLTGPDKQAPDKPCECEKTPEPDLPARYGQSTEEEMGTQDSGPTS